MHFRRMRTNSGIDIVKSLLFVSLCIQVEASGSETADLQNHNRLGNLTNQSRGSSRKGGVREIESFI